jgi:hypothetical protein
MTDDKREIGKEELSGLVVSSRSCRVDRNGCEMKPKDGRVVFRLDEFEHEGMCQIYVRRNSGNGIFSVSSAGAANDFVSLSRICDIFEVDIGKDSMVEVVRPKYSVGSITIFGISVYVDKSNMEGDELVKKWKLFSSKCDKHSGIKLVKDRLFAFEGGFVESDSVTFIETDPPDVYTKDGSKFSFFGSCEITDFGVDKEDIEHGPDIYQARYAPGPEVIRDVPAAANDDDVFDDEGAVLGERSGYPSEFPFENPVIYDSMASNGLSKMKLSSKKHVKFITSAGRSFLVIKPNGTCSIPILAIQSGNEYEVTVNAKKLSGNGKVRIRTSCKSVMSSDIKDVLISDHFSDCVVRVKIKPTAHSGEPHKVEVMMSENGTGEVLVSRVLVIKIPTESVIGEKALRRLYSCNKDKDNALLEYDMKSTYKNDSVYIASKKFARYKVLPHHIENRYDDIEGKVSPQMISGFEWFNKVRPFFQNLELAQASDDEYNNIMSVCGVGSAVSTERIWMDVFDTDEISKEDIAKISKAGVIFSPSLSNTQFLEAVCQGSSVILTHKPLPHVEPKPISYFKDKEYILSFDRSDATTKRLIKTWDKKMPKIALVGARGKFPDFVIPVSEYVPYDRLLYLMLNAECVVDLPVYFDYISSYLHLAVAFGIPVVSTNRFVLDKSNSIFVLRNDIKDKTALPSVKELRVAILDAIGMGKGESCGGDQYNEEMHKVMLTLFS